MDVDRLRNQVIEHIGAGESEDALELLAKEIDKKNAKYKDIINLKARLAEAKQAAAGGKATFDEIGRWKSEIRSGIIEIVETLQQKDLTAGYTGMVVGSPGILSDQIPVFFSRGTPYNERQKRFVNEFVNLFLEQGIRLETPEWSEEKPLLPVRRKLKEVYGCVMLATERMKSTESIYKPGTTPEQKFREEIFPTPWIQMESAMAYQQELPLLIFAEDRLKEEGMIELDVHEFRIFKVNLDDTDEFRRKFSTLIKGWADKVRQNFLARQSI